MAFPQVRDAAAGATTSDSLTHSVVLPATVASGDILLAFFSCDGIPTLTWDNATAGAWTLGSDNVRTTLNRFAVYWRRADGTEGGKTLSVVTSAAEQAVFRVLSLSDVHASSNPEFGTAASATSANPNPPALTPSWGSDDVLWFACFGNDDGRRSMSVIPANYGFQFYDSSNGPSGCGMGTARRELTAASDDPGAFTISASHGWVAQTVAVRGGTPAERIGTLAATLGTATSSGSGGVLVSGTSGNTLGAATGTASGTVADPVITGTLAATLGTATASSAGAVRVAGSSAPTLGAATAAATAAATVAGASAQTLGAAAAAGAGTVALAGSAAVTLGAATLSATASSATPEIGASLAATLDAATAAADGSALVAASASPTLGAVTGTASGSAVIGGALAQSLGAAGLSASGAALATGNASAGLGALVAASAGVVAVAGTAANTLGTATLSAQGGAPSLSASSAITLDAATAAGAGGVRVTVTASPVLGALSVVASGTVEVAEIAGAAAVEFGGLSVEADASAEVSGDLSALLGVLVVARAVSAIPAQYAPRGMAAETRNNGQAESRPATEHGTRNGNQASHGTRRNSGHTGRG